MKYRGSGEPRPYANKITYFQVSMLIFCALALIFLISIQDMIVAYSKAEITEIDYAHKESLHSFLTSLRDFYRGLPKLVHDLVWSLYRSCIYLIIPFTLLFDCIFLSLPLRALLNVGFRQDLIWCASRLLLIEPVLIMPFLDFLDNSYNAHLRFLSVDVAASLPFFVQVLLGLLLNDFLIWISHVLLHKNPILWSFHAVHHSQEHMNVLTSDRGHPVDQIFSRLLSFVPLLVFSPGLPTLATVVVLQEAMQRFIHSNVRLNFGILGYILVSPQFHRVHHSFDERHRDKNFGTIFSIWDHLFGTAYAGTTEYPATGIADPAFPYEGRAGSAHLTANICRQIAYPFEQLFCRWRRLESA